MSESQNPGEFTQISFGLGNEMYAIPCAICGKPVTTWVKRRTVTFKCKNCRDQEKEQADSLKRQISELTQLRRLEGAKELILRQCGNLEDYEHAIEAVYEKIHTPQWFQSINEVAVALEFVRCKVRAHHQVEADKYRVDFVLPDARVLLEIDGEQHKNKNVKDRDRIKNSVVVAKFGPQWEMVRISDKFIKQNLQGLIPAIKAVVQNRRKVRKSHNGRLPVNYSEQI